MEKAKVVTTFGIQNQWKDLFKNVDLDNNGSIDYEEWITAAIDKTKMLNSEEIKKVFNLLGGDDDGYLDTLMFRSKMPSRQTNNMKPENAKGDKLMMDD